jgi:outer membrane protein assembly factor BamB
MKFTPALLAIALVTTASAEWNRFRGPNGSGVADSSNLPAAIDESTTLWKRELGKGWSSPSLWQDKVIVTAETGGKKRAVICLNAKDGTEAWRYEAPFAEHRQHNFNSFASSTPFIDAAAIYVTWSSGDRIEALALSHGGQLLWHNDHVADYIHEHGTGVSPVVADGTLLVRSEFDFEKNGKPLGTDDQKDWKSSIVGLDAATGKQRWKNEIPNTLNPYSTPVIHDTAGGKHEFIVSNTTSGVMGLDTASGKKNWQYNPGYKQRSLGSYAFSADQLFCTFGSGGGGKEIAALQLSPSGEPKPLNYPIAKGLPYVPTPLVLGEHLYLLGDGGILKCVQWATGAEVYDERLNGTKGSTKFFSSPVSADGKIYCGSQTGDLVVVQTGAQFKQLSTSMLDSPINATPAIGKDRIYVRTEKMLWCAGNKGSLP